MNTLETAIVWPLIFIAFLTAIALGLRCMTVTFRQVEYYDSSWSETSPSEITHLVEVIHDALEEI